MRKNLLVIFAVVVSLFLMATIVSAADTSKIVGQDVEHMVGLGFPTYGWAEHNEAGELTGYKGFNLGLGYSKKNYFKSGLK